MSFARGTGPASGCASGAAFRRRVPVGARDISLTPPSLSASLCGATPADTRLNAIAYVARNSCTARRTARGRPHPGPCGRRSGLPQRRRRGRPRRPSYCHRRPLPRPPLPHRARPRLARDAADQRRRRPVRAEPGDRHDQRPGGCRGRPLHALRPGRHRVHQARPPIHRCRRCPAHEHRHRARQHPYAGPGVRARAAHRQLRRRAYRSYGFTGTAFPSGKLDVTLLMR